jgi:hypothetical protein
LEAGIHIEEIEVPLPTELAGYDDRVAIHKMDGIYLKTIVLCSGQQTLIIVNCDILYIPEEVYTAVRSAFSSEILILNATHNHSAPDPKRMSLSKQIIESIMRARTSLVESELHIGKTDCRIGVGRRKKIFSIRNLKKWRLKRTVEMRPNSKSGIRDGLYSIMIKQEGKAISYLVNYACHPCMWHGASLSSDFVGRIEMDAPVFFLQGFAGDVDADCRLTPRSVKEWIVRFIEGENFKGWDIDVTDIENVAKRIQKTLQTITYKKVEEDFRKSTVEIPLSFKDGQESLMRINLIRIGNGYSFLCIPGEVFNAYATMADKIFEGEIITLGYTNGMVGYLPTSEAILEGGYEVEQAWRFYGLPDAYSETLEEDILTGLRKLKTISETS